ncbi:hypothetical protein CERSUDRAFT_127310 [Gelatoporia subvermispora B]|uniref:Uncharacterized protein n=1 Tax=Ceriporiopsis subvermispora (strain B) TaxID=914234 RepID=M2QHM6_CERS8|nr:hypothetical protein CERSUDRAFT_127310 [Gelatoporia subvermispora B]
MKRIPEDIYYCGSPWSVTNFRDRGVAQRLLGVNTSKWTNNRLDEEMRRYYAKQLPGSGFLTGAAIYGNDKEIHWAYWDFVADMTKIRDDLVIIVFILDIKPESQCEPDPNPPQYNFRDSRSLWRPRWAPRGGGRPVLQITARRCRSVLRGKISEPGIISRRDSTFKYGTSRRRMNVMKRTNEMLRTDEYPILRSELLHVSSRDFKKLSGGLSEISLAIHGFTGLGIVPLKPGAALIPPLDLPPPRRAQPLSLSEKYHSILSWIMALLHLSGSEPPSPTAVKSEHHSEEEEDYHSTDSWSRVRYVEHILVTIAKFTPQVHATRYKTVLNIMMEHHAANATECTFRLPHLFLQPISGIQKTTQSHVPQTSSGAQDHKSSRKQKSTLENELQYDYYYGFPWSVTRFRETKAAERLLKLDSSKCTHHALSSNMRGHFEKRLRGLVYMVKMTVYEDIELQLKYQNIVRDVTIALEGPNRRREIAIFAIAGTMDPNDCQQEPYHLTTISQGSRNV